MKNEKFTITMQTDDLTSHNLNKILVDEAINLVFEDSVVGNYNFFCIKNNLNNNFIQTIFEDGQWNVEYSNGNGIIFQLKTLNEPNEFFYSFILGKNINLEYWEKVYIQDL